MTEVKILVDGYAKEIENGWLASSTTTLVKIDGKNIVVDPGCNRTMLIEALKENDLELDDINYVLITHNHLDHSLLAGIFENAKMVYTTEIYEGDKQVEYGDNIPDLDIEIIKTPGHSTDSRSFIVKADNGLYAIAGDVFWWTNTEEQKTDFDSLINHADPYAGDMTVLQVSRKKVLEIADYIIPGHGKMWKVEK